MNKNIEQTKKKLTIIFSIIVFFSILILGFFHFSFKYFKEINIEKTSFNNLVYLIENKKISINEVINFGNRLDKNIFRDKSFSKKRMENPYMLENPAMRFFVNYIYIDNENKVISSNLREGVTGDFILNIFDDNSFLKTKQNSGFLIKKINLENNSGVFIILKKIDYNFSKYLNDILWFVIINILFSIFIYFIGKRFVGKILFPVEENLKDMKDFIHNVSHELKTPISVIDSNIQLINDMKVYDEQMTNELKKEVLRLNSIIDGLIKLTDLDSQKELNNIVLKDIIQEIIIENQKNLDEKNIIIKNDINKDVIIKANKDYFYIFLSNIISNSIKYNKKGGQIIISYIDNELLIKDTGIGIKQEELDKIFDRFFKCDKSRNSEGFGIGLSLVSKIANIYNWKIKVESKPLDGTTFKIKFN